MYLTIFLFTTPTQAFWVQLIEDTIQNVYKTLIISAWIDNMYYN